MESPDQIRYITKDMCAPLSKENAYAYYLAEGRDRETFVAFAKRILSFDDITESNILKHLNDKLKSISSVTGFARIWKHIEELRLAYPSSIVKNIDRLLPSFTCTTYNMCGVNDPKLDNILVWEMNAISPEITGYFFENMLAYVLDLTYEKDTSAILRRKDSEITIDQFNKMMERIRAEMYDTIDANVNVHKYDEIKEILDASVLAYLEKNNLTETIAAGIRGLYKYIYTWIDALNEYLENLKKSTIAMSMSREIGMEHSKYVESSDPELPIHGEIDFCSNSYITDAKCYKTEDYLGWFIQLYLYRALLDNHALQLRIINFNTNKVHEFRLNR